MWFFTSRLKKNRLWSANYMLRGHRKARRSPVKRTKFVWEGGGFQKNRTLGLKWCFGLYQARNRLVYCACVTFVRSSSGSSSRERERERRLWRRSISFWYHEWSCIWLPRPRVDASHFKNYAYGPGLSRLKRLLVGARKWTACRRLIHASLHVRLDACAQRCHREA